ncbi:Na+/H+ antiporter [Hymenobacter cavernae]|uniref:Na+/H+ antiporter n=1 Tax=Hymenobacter cavernae TaxID=2044852 RepID=A0ABQ1THQ4_9BACT|nr:Na+/H+ antiporter [Hymenobacter cavernae]GGE93682.1 Na+/H+ antiporter [Hymenobacter cavernae]
MKNLEIVLLLMVVMAVLSAIAHRFRLPYAVLLVLAGLVIGFIPGLPSVALDPDIIFLVFLPPLLYEASFNVSWHDFKANRAEISLLAIGLVFFTTTVVACVAHYFIPGFSWPLAFVLGAIVSPPDAVAATSVTQGLGLPKKITSVLEGESLVNDASALIAYRYAVAAVVSGGFAIWDAGLQFLLVAGGGVLIGLGIGYTISWVQTKVADATIATTLTLLAPYLAYLGAEHFGASGVLAVVFTGLVVSWRSLEIYQTNTRLQRRSFWSVLGFLLNGFVFIIIGLELPHILEGSEQASLSTLIGYGLLVSAVAIIIRIVWVFPSAYFLLFLRRLRNKSGAHKLDLKGLFITSWAGMRGVVSLATALALPLALQNGQPFPQRNVLLFITFVVILVTLVLQSFTLPWFIRWLNVQEPEEKLIAEQQQLRLEIENSALAFVEQKLADEPNDATLLELKEMVERRVNRLHESVSGAADPNDDNSDQNRFEEFLQNRIEVTNQQRALLVHLHKDGKFSAEAIRRVQLELDRLEMSLQTQLEAVE